MRQVQTSHTVDCQDYCLRAALVAVLSFYLAGCGSGAVSSPTAPSATPLAVSPPSADIFPDIPTTFTVTGGAPAYSAFSSNSVVLPVSSTVSGNTFTVVAKSVTADTPVEITVRDSASATPVTAKINVKPTTLNNLVTFTPVAPTGNGCGSNAMCSGGDALFAVKASLNGVVLNNRPIRFDVNQGSFQLVTPGSGALVSTLIVNTDEQGGATVRITANVGAATQVATIQSTDVTSGLARRYSFNIAQVTSGAGILSTLPSGVVTFKGAKGAVAGQDGTCPGGPGARVDYYVFGGTPPYSVASPLPGFAAISPSIIAKNGGGFSAQISGCGKTAFIVTDATGRTVETSAVEGIQGDKGDAVAASPLTVSQSALTIACGSSGTVILGGAGNFTASAANTAGDGFTISPTAGTLPNTVSLIAASGTVNSPVAVNFSSVGQSTVPVVVTITGTTSGKCP